MLWLSYRFFTDEASIPVGHDKNFGTLHNATICHFKVPIFSRGSHTLIQLALTEHLWTLSSKPIKKKRIILQRKTFTTFTHIMQAWKKIGAH